jgi:hypothetical protein
MQLRRGTKEHRQERSSRRQTRTDLMSGYRRVFLSALMTTSLGHIGGPEES